MQTTPTQTNALVGVPTSPNGRKPLVGFVVTAGMCRFLEKL